MGQPNPWTTLLASTRFSELFEYAIMSFKKTKHAKYITKSCSDMVKFSGTVGSLAIDDILQMLARVWVSR